MKPSARAIAAALAIIVPTHMLWFLADGAAVAALLVCVGIALPAVWSENPARRKAAAAVLSQILNACTGADRRETTSQASTAREMLDQAPPTRWASRHHWGRS